MYLATELTTIRKIMDAATADDLPSACKALNDFADQRNGQKSNITQVNLNGFGQSIMNMEETRRRLPINDLP